MAHVRHGHANEDENDCRSNRWNAERRNQLTTDEADEKRVQFIERGQIRRLPFRGQRQRVHAHQLKRERERLKTIWVAERSQERDDARTRLNSTVHVVAAREPLQ
jgi:hypothetical protein